MVSVTVQFQIKFDYLAKFKSAVLEFSNESSKEPGCMRHTITQSKANPQNFTMYEEYRSLDDHCTHNNMEHHIEFKKQIADCIIEKKVVISEYGEKDGL